MGKSLEILVTAGPLSGKRFSLKAGSILRLGRSSTNDIQIPDEELSRNHCLFDGSGATGLCVTDLASANGTYLNGRAMGSASAQLKAGDVLEVGISKLIIVEEGGSAPDEASKPIDLGLGAGASKFGPPRLAPPKESGKRVFLYGLLVCVLVVAGAAVYFLSLPQKSVPAVEAPAEPVLSEFTYEKVTGSTNGLFRYELTLTPEGLLKVSVDDLPRDNRHLEKSVKLSAEQLKELNGKLAWAKMKAFDPEYTGAEPDEPSLFSERLRVVYDQAVRAVSILNQEEPDDFKTLRENLEAFSRNELGIWAIQYSREKLEELSQEAVARGDSKWEDREVKVGNLYEAIQAYREALFYLETVNPKPQTAETARLGLERAEKELKQRYSDQRFLADRALNLQHWEEAKKELSILMEMVPDRSDERYREASAKLVDVEKRLKKGGK